MSLAFLLLTAGHETTANMISLGVLGLLSHPDQLALITADPGRTPGAVEELLRYFTITDTVTARVATEDVKTGGVSIRAGEGVIVSALSADCAGGSTETWSAPTTPSSTAFMNSRSPGEMRIKAGSDLCVGSGQCVLTEPRPRLDVHHDHWSVSSAEYRHES